MVTADLEMISEQRTRPTSFIDGVSTTAINTVPSLMQKHAHIETATLSKYQVYQVNI